MKSVYLVFWLSVVPVVAIVACAPASPDEVELRALLKKGTELMNEPADWREAWKTFSPKTREICPYEEFLSAVEKQIAEIGGVKSNFRLINVRIEIAGDTAYASYLAIAPGGGATPVKDDVYVKVDGTWYEVDEGAILCPDSGEGVRR